MYTTRKTSEDLNEDFTRQDNFVMPREDRYEALLLMQHHDSLLQAYRSQFLIFQTIALLLTGFFIFQGTIVDDPWKLAAIFLFSVFAGPVFIFAIWTPIVNSRNEMVARAKYLLKTNQMVDFSPFKIIGNNGSKFNIYFDERELAELEKTQTRTRLDRIIPWAFAFFWSMLLLYLYGRIVLMIFLHQ